MSLQGLSQDIRLCPPAPRYLLFTGDGPASGGVSDLVAVFDSEQEARLAFTAVRRDNRADGHWAELCVVGAARADVKVLCSFGRGRPSRWTTDSRFHPNERKGPPMSTTAITNPDHVAEAQLRRSPPPAARRSKFVAMTAAAIALAALILIDVPRHDSTGPMHHAPLEAPVPAIQSAGQGNWAWCMRGVDCEVYEESSRS